jgi:hypothetical protein
MTYVTPINFINLLNTHADGINLFVALSKFNYDSTSKHTRIYCSVFFIFGYNIFQWKTLLDSMHDSYHFKDLVFISVIPRLNDKEVFYYEKIKFNISNTNLFISQVNLSHFFNKKNLEELSSKYGSKKDSSIILHFKGISWPIIKTAFHKLNIHIGGDNNTLKHILSPHQLLLSKFIMLYFGPNSDEVGESFNALAKDKPLTRAVFDFTSDKGKEFLKELDISLSQDTNATSNIKNSTDVFNIQKRGFHYKRYTITPINGFSLRKTILLSQRERSFSTLENYNVEESNVLKPILGNKNNLLAPIVYNDNIKDNIKHCDYVLSRIPENNMVKNYITKELDNKIIVTADLGIRYKEILKVISSIKNYHEEEIVHSVDENGKKTCWSVSTSMNPFTHIDNDYSIFNFNYDFLKSRLFIEKEDEEIIKEYTFNVMLPNLINKKHDYNDVYDKGMLNKTSEKNLLKLNDDIVKTKTTYYNVKKGKKLSYSNSLDSFSCCYAITFNNNLYYYIGSTTNITDRVKNHHTNLQKIIHKVTRDTLDPFINVNDIISTFLEHYILSEICRNINLEYKISPVYISTNYLKKFELLNPQYKLSKGEWILLTSITDLLVKILEQSLIVKFKPKLNTLNNVAIKHFVWHDRYLEEYSSGTSLYKEYTKTNKYLIKIPNPHYKKDFIISLLGKRPNRKDSELYTNEYLIIGPRSEHQLCKQYNLDINEVLDNLNILHNYNGCTLKQPMIIIPQP